MSGMDHYVGWQLGEPRQRRVHCRLIRPGDIGSAMTAGKEHIAANQNEIRLRIKGDVRRFVTWNMEDPKGVLADLNLLARILHEPA